METYGMEKYVCLICGHVYDPHSGDSYSDIPPDTDFQNLPEDWFCPECGGGKSEFVAETD